jgi:hypothetical protein
MPSRKIREGVTFRQKHKQTSYAGITRIRFKGLKRQAAYSQPELSSAPVNVRFSITGQGKMSRQNHTLTEDRQKVIIILYITKS